MTESPSEAWLFVSYDSKDMGEQREFSDQGPLLLTWFNFNPSMDK